MVARAARLVIRPRTSSFTIAWIKIVAAEEDSKVITRRIKLRFVENYAHPINLVSEEKHNVSAALSDRTDREL